MMRIFARVLRIFADNLFPAVMKKILNERIAISSSNPIRARFYDYRGFTYPWHFHSEYELMFVEQGYGKCLVGDSIIDYRAGDLIFFGSGLPHCMQNCPEAEENEAYHVCGVNIQLEKDFMQYSFSHYTQFASIRSLLEKAHRGIRFPLAGKSEITDCLKRIPVVHGVEQMIEILKLLQALSAFPRKQFAASPNYLPDPSVFGDKKIEKIIAYLNKRYTQPVSLGEIASYTAMNEAAFCRYFKQETGKTFKQYILDMRIGYACKLLAAGRMNVSQISLECGFESTAHFNRIFKRLTGMAPTSYRESIL